MSKNTKACLPEIQVETPGPGGSLVYGNAPDYITERVPGRRCSFPNAPDISHPQTQFLSAKRKRAAKEQKLSNAATVYFQLVRGDLRKQERLNLRHEVLKAYGGKCECCGESELEFLTIDHVFRNGSAERKALGRLSMYQYLKANNFPKHGYRAYCMNCNWGSRLTGKCPHKKAPILTAQ